MIKHQIFEDVHYWQVARSFSGRYLYATGFFYVDSILIDCGPTNMGHSLGKLFSGLDARKVLITHHHEDHTGNLHRFDGKNVTIHAHPRSEALLRQVCDEIPLYRRLIWGCPKPASMSPIPPETETEKRCLEIVHTPGHADDHICLFERKSRWLFTGDLYLASYLRYLRDDENIYEIMKSLQRLIDLHPDVLFCNHRGFVPDGEKQLAKKLSFLQDLRDHVLRSHEQGTPTEDVIHKILRPDRFFRWFSRGEFSTTNLVHAFLRKQIS
jgi:glyoxylase-like metal-dependent hydrolase (beta-lactamase superfamily II)